MNRYKLLILGDVAIEAGKRLTDLLEGDEDLSAFFEDPYLDDVLECADEPESPVIYQ